MPITSTNGRGGIVDFPAGPPLTFYRLMTEIPGPPAVLVPCLLNDDERKVREGLRQLRETEPDYRHWYKMITFDVPPDPAMGRHFGTAVLRRLRRGPMPDWAAFARRALADRDALYARFRPNAARPVNPRS